MSRLWIRFWPPKKGADGTRRAANTGVVEFVVHVKVISLEQAPEGYKSFDAGVANKYVVDPHGQLPFGG
jgi:hypothetical protein